MVNVDSIVAEILADVGPIPSRANDLHARLLDRDALANLPNPRWLVESWFTTGSLALLYGKPGDGKTFLALDVACSVATGSRWHGQRTEPGPVLYIAAEGASMFDARTAAWEGRHDTAVVELYVLPDAVNLLDADWADALAEVAYRIGAKAVVVDTLNRCMIGGDENAARDMGMFVAGCDTIRRTSGATVLVVHHDSRAGGNPRGSSALDGAADTIIAISADNMIVTARTTKQKDAEPAAPLLLKLEPADRSAVLVNYVDHDALDGARLEVLRALCDIADTNGVASGVWERETGLAHRSFHRARKWLVERDLCHDVSGTRTPRYAPTDAGLAACAKQVPPSAVAPGEVVPANPPLLGVGTWHNPYDATPTEPREWGRSS